MRKAINAAFALFIFYLPVSTFTGNSTKVNADASYAKSDINGYIYVQVFKDGIWWMYVYDEDNILINTYPILD